jgi:hypothetical protein
VADRRQLNDLIEGESTEKEGTTFTLHMPRQRVTTATRPFWQSLVDKSARRPRHSVRRRVIPGQGENPSSGRGRRLTLLQVASPPRERAFLRMDPRVVHPSYVDSLTA